MFDEQNRIIYWKRKPPAIFCRAALVIISAFEIWKKFQVFLNIPFSFADVRDKIKIITYRIREVVEWKMHMCLI